MESTDGNQSSNESFGAPQRFAPAMAPHLNSSLPNSNFVQSLLSSVKELQERLETVTEERDKFVSISQEQENVIRNQRQVLVLQRELVRAIV